MEHFEITFLFKGNSVKALVVKQQTPAEITYYVHIDADITPLQNPQRFSFIDGAFNEIMPDEFEDTPLLRNTIWQEIHSRIKKVL
ncbi:MAG: hypothetical protein QM768_05550 [Agriterribacter sp.]